MLNDEFGMMNGIRNDEFGMMNGFGIWDFSIWNLSSGFWNLEFFPFGIFALGVTGV
jgi:hypothetical protein